MSEIGVTLTIVVFARPSWQPTRPNVGITLGHERNMGTGAWEVLRDLPFFVGGLEMQKAGRSKSRIRAIECMYLTGHDFPSVVRRLPQVNRRSVAL
jgi:hypothetical protein